MTSCRGIAGMKIESPTNHKNTPYSAGPIFLASRWTAYMNSPETTVATSSHPLSRKNPAREFMSFCQSAFISNQRRGG